MMTGDYIETTTLIVDVQENGIIRMASNGFLIGELSNDIDYETIKSLSAKNYGEVVVADKRRLESLEKTVSSGTRTDDSALQWSSMTEEERDRLVARKVVRLAESFDDDWDAYWYGYYHLGGCGHYTTDIRAAFQVFEKMKARNAWIEIAWSPFMKAYRCSIGSAIGDLKSADVVAQTASEAICLAALRAVGVEVED